jgi:hypothetical protein
MWCKFGIICNNLGKGCYIQPVELIGGAREVTHSPLQKLIAKSIDDSGFAAAKLLSDYAILY